ncbi:sn-glycerol-3-phosphate ABC transporter permease UgpE [Chachezhania antarctica]|uniref:sn-glycerol-3-phosphate ABC transporter permease UgpE n=1 Tax=Chachezhania antarctica TaxID=2340860 RepID=UPI000EB1948D|nr:sn-glycerol-3-phosphate ABC transporter permease UgpE [Chachezhania antarctica]|tara:strand:- start:2266 stop:3114 length:849 start_codon:yes stop_codon:yes gene_type:complete
MVENRRLLDILGHILMLFAVALVVFPIWVAFVASTQASGAIMSGTVPLWPGDQLIQNYATVLGKGVAASGAPPILLMLGNSLIMAIGIAVGKITISLIAAYAIVYFRFPFRTFIFWTIFITLMLPVEVRIMPTFEVVANLGLLNSYGGLILPVIASATATFLFRQFFMTVPEELCEAARIDGAGPLKFFWDILLPLSRTNIAALFVIMFIFGWNQYLWPLLVTSTENLYTIVMGIQRLVTVADAEPQWPLVMATTILAMLPPVLIIVVMQRLFVQGLVETEK